MNEEAQKIFDKIVKKNPQDLTDEEVKFLHARRPYLTDEQLRIFKFVLDKREVELGAKIASENPEPPVYVSKKDKKHASN